jgi:hypothetical protein
MSIHDQLSLYAYNLSTATQSARSNIGPFLEDLTMTTNAPGGFGRLTGKYYIKNTRTLPPEFNIMANVALMEGPQGIWLGRWDEPGIALSDNNGDYFDLSAIGAGDCLKDDPNDFSYSAQTAKAMLADQITQRSAYLPLSTDTSRILPDNPSGTFTKGTNGMTFEQFLNDVLAGLGDYTWGVWGHVRDVDASGLPKWQLYVHSRDTATTTYQIIESDIQSARLRPAAEYSYNVVTLLYKDSTTFLPSSVTVRDSRLAANLAQNTAPIPARRDRLDYSNLLLSATQANTIANARLAAFKNGGWKIEVVLSNVRNAAGNSIPLWQCQADGNLFSPAIATWAATQPFGPVSLSNQWYITQTSYQESRNGSSTLTVTLSAFEDTAAFQLAKLQYQQQMDDANKRTTGLIQSAGIPEMGYAAASAPSTATAGTQWTASINFKATMVNTPTITLSGTASNCSATAVNITQFGFTLRITTTGNGAASWTGTYQTVGN